MITQIACGVLIILGSVFAASFYSAQLGDYSYLVMGLGLSSGLPLIICHSNKPHATPRGRRERYGNVADVEEKIVQATNHLFHPPASGDSILRNPQVTGVKYHHSSDTHKVFEIDTKPGSIFKTSVLQGDIERRYKKMEEARAIIAKHHLDSLVVPDVTLAQVPVSTGWWGSKKVTVLVEKRYELESDEAMQGRIEAEGQEEEIFHTAVFTILAKWNDLARGNFARIERENKRLISDVESMGTPRGDVIGLFGGETEEEIIEGRSVIDQSRIRYRQNARLGLMGCIGEKYFPQVKRAIEHCQRPDLLPLYEEARRQQRTLIAQEADLPRFYQAKGIGIEQPGQTLAVPPTAVLDASEKAIAVWMLGCANDIFKRHVAKYAGHPIKYIRQFTIIYKDAPSALAATKAKIDALAHKFIQMRLFHHIIAAGKAQLRINA